MTQAVAAAHTGAQFYTIREFAEVLGVHPQTVRTMISEGRVKALRPSARVIRIPARELDRLVAEAGATAPTVDVRQERIQAAQSTIAKLFAKYQITSATSARRLIAERFSQADLDAYHKALGYLNGQAVIG